MKDQVQHMAGMNFSAPTVSVSVELFMLIFYVVEPTMGNTRPRYKAPSECPQMLVPTANDTSTHHFKIPLPLALRVSEILLVPLWYCIRLTN